MSEGIRLAPLLTEIKVDIDKFKSDMNKAASLGVLEATKISDKMATATKVGDGLSKVGDKLTKGLTLPLAGISVVAGKMAVDFESSFAQVSTLLDKNIVDYDTYKNEILDASDKSKVAVGEFSEAVYGSISAGVDQTKAIEFTTEAMKLAKGGFTDGASAVDILTTAINGYGMSAEDTTKIADMLITTQNLGKTTVNELASSMGAVIPIANSVNFGMDELSASYAQLTKNGIATAESGTYLKAMLSELGKSGSTTDKALRELTGKSFAELKKEGKSTSDILAILSEEAENNGMTLKDMFGSVEAGSAALVLAKDGGDEYNEMLEAMQDSAGATQEAFDKMDATPAEKMKGAINKLKNAGIKFGEAFIPVIDKASDAISGLADWFSSLSEEEKQNAIQWGAVLLAAGPVFKVIGGGITTFTKLSSVIGGATKALGVAGAGSVGSGIVGGLGALSTVALPLAGVLAGVGTAIYAVHENSELMNSTALKSRDEMSWLEKVLADLQGTTTYTKEELQNMGYVHKDFSENISPEFQKAVADSTTELQDFNVFLQETTFDGVLDEAEQNNFNTRVESMCNKAIETINGKKEEANKSLSDLFVADGVLDQSEQNVLDYFNQSYDTSTTKIQEIKDEVHRIKQQAIDEQRALNDEEIRNINEHLGEVKRLELEALGGTQEELLYSKNEFANRVATMDLESASKLLQDKAKIRDEEIIKVKSTYDTEIELLNSNLSSMDEATRKDAELQIANLEADKQNKIQNQNDLYNKYLGIIQDGNANSMNEINKYNGELLTKADIVAQKEFEQMKNKYSNLQGITESGCYSLYNTNSNTWDRVTISVDENTGKIIGMQEMMSKETGGYTQKIADSTNEMAESERKSYDIINNALGVTMDCNGRVVDSNDRVVDSMRDIKTATDGTTTGIIELNGTPYEIQVEKNGTLSALKEINNAADYAAKDRTIYINTITTSTQKWMDSNQVNGHHYNGLDNVPYDGYRARLHKNERVLTAAENKEYSTVGKDRMISYPENITAVLQIDGREFTRATIPFINEALGEKANRRT